MNIRTFSIFASLLLIVSITGSCKTGPRDVHQFDPLPQAAITGDDLAPVKARTAPELLTAADEAFRKGNAAQESGDNQEAMRQYNLMLELMIEADVDPEVFYSFRTEFGRMFESMADDPLFFDRTLDDAWIEEARSRGGVSGTLPMPSVTPKRVLDEIDKIKNAYPKNFQAGLDRSFKYRSQIERIFAEAGVPAELAALAMVESQFHPDVRSRAGAVGMWQFMPATGKRYNLRIDRYVDERRDWEKATAAAAQYLSDLHKFFNGDWALALTAYNMGEYGLERAIAANGGDRNLWRLLETPPASNMIHRETKEFYAKMLASTIIMRDPERHGFVLRPQPAESTTRVNVRGSHTLASLEKAAGLEKDTLKRLNPQLVLGSTPPQEYQLVVPEESSRVVLAALRKTPKETVPDKAPVVLAAATAGDGFHVVRAGETLSAVAAMYNVALTELRAMNGNVAPNRLQVGARLRIPGNGAAEGGARETYRVRRGDTLLEIAKRENVSVSDLREWNNLGNRSTIRTGDTLYVSKRGDSAAQPAGSKKYVHKVASGESAGAISARYAVKLDDLLAWNKLSRNSILRVGDELLVYQPDDTPATSATVDAALARPASTGSGDKRVHTVQKGENPSIIASKYSVALDDVLAWNDLSKSSVLHVGDELVIYAGDPDEPIAEAPKKITHVVERGQNPTSIAKQYGVSADDILKWNGWDRNRVLHVGDKVTIVTQ